MSTGQLSILSPQEIKHIDALRRQERRWPRWRWAILALGLGFALGSCLAGHVLWIGLSGIGDNGDEAMGILVISFLCVSQACLALFILPLAFRAQPANSTRRLLLKLADALSERQNGDEKRG